MCGVMMFHLENKKNLFKTSLLEYLFKELEVRGADGVGVYIYNYDSAKNIYVEKVFRDARAFSKIKDSVLSFIRTYTKDDSIVLCYTRNAPETEVLTDARNLEEYMQPIVKPELTLIHNGVIGAGIVKEYQNKMTTQIDTEAIYWHWKKYNKNVKETFENMFGGWSVIAVDKEKHLVYGITSHLPLAMAYIRGVGFFMHSSARALRIAISGIDKNVLSNIDEGSFYFKDVSKMKSWVIDADVATIYEYNYKTRTLSAQKYNIKYAHPLWTYDTDIRKTKALVMASSGIDSTTTMAVLKYLGYDVEALHFIYPQKSADAELIAIQHITKLLDVPLKIIDLRQVYSVMCESSMLTNENLEVTTGTDENAKTSVAWVPGRNYFFLTVAAVYAEDLILKNKTNYVLIAGGFPNISEEGVYPDNSQVFVDRWQKTIESCLLSGLQRRIKYANVLQGFTKTEELLLLKYLGYEHVFGETVSCYRAKVIDGEVYQCAKDGIPACSSGKFAKYAAELAGIKDTRRYYEIDDPNYVHYVPGWEKQKDVVVNKSLEDLLARVRLPSFK